MKYIKSFFNTNISFLVILFIAVFALYGKSINFELTGLDDNILIKKNINLISNYKNIPKLFITSAFYDNTTAYYRPILSLSFATESFFVRDNLKVYHLTNIILFVLSIYLFYLFCMELKLNSAVTKFILLLIAVHPMFSSVVVWIPGRNDSLLTVFFISSFIFFIKYINSQKMKYAVCFCIFFIISLFTKETFILLIPLYFVYLFLYDYKVSKKNLTFLFISVIPFVLLFFILRHISIASYGLGHYISQINIVLINFIKYLFFFFYNFFVPEYVPMMLFNANLSLQIIVYNCLFIGLFAFCLYKKIIPVKVFVFSMLLILLSLFPSFFQEEIVYLNHRFLICSIGFIICLIYILNYLINKFNKTKKYLIAFFCLFFVSFFYLSCEQFNKYKNYETFWVNAYLDSPEYYLANLHLSRICMNKGLFEEAEQYAQKAVELKQCYNTFINYIDFLMVTNELEKAKTMLLQVEKYVNKDSIFFKLSEIYYRKKDYEKALDYALKSYNIKDYDINYCQQLIKIYDETENYNEELKIYENLLKFDNKNKIYENKITELKEKIRNKETNNA